MMKIVADENIPFVEYYFANLGELIVKPGREITRHDVVDADILLVRSVTKVDQSLLQNTKVKIVGSATTGFDHIDVAWLQQQGIRLHLALGSNSIAVVEYVVSVVALLQNMNLLPEKKLTAGIIGVGRIGSRVADVLKMLGFEIVYCDPVRAEHETNFISTPVEDLVGLDFISLHTPLTMDGAHPTYQLLSEDFFQRQKKNTVLVNTSRGEVIASKALKQYGRQMVWALDVWEHEPFIDLELLKLASVATPHIAGYSVQAKNRGIEMIYAELVAEKVIDEAKPMLAVPKKIISFEHKQVSWRDVVLKIFNPEILSTTMKNTLLTAPNKFDLLRKEFNNRYEFGWIEIKDANLSATDEAILKNLGMLVTG